MHPLALSGSYRLAAGIILGIVFGILLVRSKLAWRQTFADLFTFKNSLIANVFLASIAVGTVIFFCLRHLGIVELNIRPVYFWGAITGGIICGIGLINCKQIPATAVAALATGKFYSIWILIGMLLAMPAVKLISGFLSDTIYSWKAPFTFHQTFAGYASPGMATSWTCAIAIILMFMSYFAFGRRGGGGDE